MCIFLYIVNIHLKLDPGEGKGNIITNDEIETGTREEFQSKHGGTVEDLARGEEHEKNMDERTDDRSGIADSSKKWPRPEGSLYVEIPYTISDSFGGTERATIGSAIEQFHAKTCIR